MVLVPRYLPFFSSTVYFYFADLLKIPCSCPLIMLLCPWLFFFYMELVISSFYSSLLPLSSQCCKTNLDVVLLCMGFFLPVYTILRLWLTVHASKYTFYRSSLELHILFQCCLLIYVIRFACLISFMYTPYKHVRCLLGNNIMCIQLV
jgi:hypothetical protein